MPTVGRFIAQRLLPPFLPLFSTTVLLWVLLLLILEMQGFKYILLLTTITRKDESTIPKSSYWKKMLSPIWFSKWRTVQCMNSCRRTREESMANYKQRDFSLVIIVIMSFWCLRLLSSVRACIDKPKSDQNSIKCFQWVGDPRKTSSNAHCHGFGCFVFFFPRKVLVSLPNILVGNRTGILDWKGQSEMSKMKTTEQG